MSYESTGYSKALNTRSIGIAFSKDIKNLKSIKEKPYLTNGEYCSSFFKLNNQIYKIVPNYQRFRVYKFNEFSEFNQDKFIGYWDPLGKNNKYSLNSPDILTKDIHKEYFSKFSFSNFIFFLRKDRMGNNL